MVARRLSECNPEAQDATFMVDGSGQIGIGTDTPASSVHVAGSDGTTIVQVVERSGTASDRELLDLTNVGAPRIAFTNTAGGSDVTWRAGMTAADGFTFDLESTAGTEFLLSPAGELTVGPDGAANLTLDANGNLTLAGTLTQGSTYTIKDNFQTADLFGILDRLVDLPVFRWNYISDADSIQHLGPTAEDFFAAFDLGADAHHVAASDLASVALVSLQGLLSVAAHQGSQLESITTAIGAAAWTSTATWLDATDLPATIDLPSAISGRASQGVSLKANQTPAAALAGSVFSHTQDGPFGSGFVGSDLQDDASEVGSHGLFLSDTGVADEYFVWQDADPSTAGVTEIRYDFRPEGLFPNLITAEQTAAAEAALDAWETASADTIRFVRDTTADRERIINLGVGDLAAFGFASANGGTLAVGGGTANTSPGHSISRGVVWLDVLERWDASIGNGDIAGTKDAFTVFAHELGHAIGIGHTDQVAGDDMMDGAYRGEQTEFSLTDQTLVQTLYGDASVGEIGQIGQQVLLADQVVNGDAIVSGSLCAGFDCINGELFGSDTLRLKENNTRIALRDSDGADWQLVANDTNNGGQSHFSIDQGLTTGASKFRVLAGAPSDSLVVDQSGRLGLGTRSPSQGIHVVADDPTVRLGQDTSAGFLNQAWDIGGDSSGFFVHNANASSTPLLIESGAPSSSVFVDADGHVGLGTDSPASKLHISRSDGTAQLSVQETSAATADRVLLSLSNQGGVLIRFSSVAPPTPQPGPDDVQIGVATEATVAGSEVTLDYYLENFGDDPLTNVDLPNNLDQLFGAGNYHIFSGPTRVSGPATIIVNPNFDGSDQTGLLDAGTLEDGRSTGKLPGSSLLPGETAHLQVIVSIDVLADQGDGLGTYNNQVTASGFGPTGGFTSDESVAGTDPDPDGDGNPDESSSTPNFVVAENAVIGLAKDVTVLGELATIINNAGTVEFGEGPLVEMTLYLENLGNVPLDTIDLTDELDAVFGAGNYGTLNSGGVNVAGEGSLVVNSSFDGSTQTNLLGVGSTLDPGDIAEITVRVIVTNVTDQGSGLGIYTNQASVIAEGPGAVVTSDLSDAGRVTDENDNGDPTDTGEDDPTGFQLGAYIGAAKDANVAGRVVTFDYVLEVYGGEDFSDLSMAENLDAVFARATTRSRPLRVSLTIPAQSP